MKKALLTFLIVFFSFFSSKSIFAASNEFSGTGFYSSIANSIGSIEASMYEIDLPGTEGTMQKINKMIGMQCFTDNISQTEVRAVALNGNLEKIFPKINQTCKTPDGQSIPTETATKISQAIIKLHQETMNSAARKTAQLMNIGSTGVYADGVKENAPFDLIIDIKNFDKIIFEQEEDSAYEGEGYEGTNNFDLGEKIGGLLNNARELNKSGRDTPGVDNNLNPDTNQVYNDLKLYSDYNLNSGSNLQCSLNSSYSSSGLSDSVIDQIFSGTHSSSGNNSLSSYNFDPLDGPSRPYSKVDDNAVFPCTEFFCINIDFVSYEHKLLGGSVTGGSQDMSIEAIISRSNDHLKKFANGSLVGSKMTTNNFELGLKSLDLTQIFHIGVQITSKPVPILNLNYDPGGTKKDSDSKSGSGAKSDDKGIFEVENQLKFYYETFLLDYTRRNDLSLLKKTELERQAILASTLLSPDEAAAQVKQIDAYEAQKRDQRKVMEGLIQNETKIKVLGDLETQFKELEVFNKSIKDYVINLSSIIDKLLEIPVDTGQN